MSGCSSKMLIESQRQPRPEENAVDSGIAAPLQKSLRVFPSLLLAQLVLVGSVLDAQASETSADSEAGSGWEFSISPYLWAAGISGRADTLPGLPPADVDESFSDIWDDLRFAGMVVGAARKGRFAIAGDLQYVETEGEDNDLAPIFGSEKLTSKTFILSAVGEYVAFEKGRSNFILSAGARLWSVETRLDLSSGLLPGRTIKGEDTWIDPILGVRGNVDVVSDVFLTGWGFVGGFGVGSDIMADLGGGVGYRFTDSISTTIGYRWMKVDRDEDDFLYDVRQQGILAGLTFRF